MCSTHHSHMPAVPVVLGLVPQHIHNKDIPKSYQELMGTDIMCPTYTGNGDAGMRAVELGERGEKPRGKVDMGNEEQFWGLHDPSSCGGQREGWGQRGKKLSLQAQPGLGEWLLKVKTKAEIAVRRKCDPVRGERKVGNTGDQRNGGNRKECGEEHEKRGGKMVARRRE